MEKSKEDGGVFVECFGEIDLCLSSVYDHMTKIKEN